MQILSLTRKFIAERLSVEIASLAQRTPACSTQLNMEDYSAKAANMARILAIVHIIVGSLLICFGIADRAVDYYYIGYGCYGIWMGIWVSCASSLYTDKLVLFAYACF